MTKYHRQWFGWSSELGCIQNGIKLRSKHSTWQSWDMPCQCFFVVWFTPFVGRSFWLHCLRWLRAALKQGKHNIYEPTHHPMGTSLISLQWTEKSMRFRAFLTKITMQETQHGQRIYHLVGGLNPIDWNSLFLTITYFTRSSLFR